MVDSVPGLGDCVRAALAALPEDRTGEVGAVGLATDLERGPLRLRPVAVLRISPPCHPAAAGALTRPDPILATASTTASAARGAALAAGAEPAVVVDAAAAELRCVSVTDGEVERSDIGRGLGGVDLDLDGIRADVLPHADLAQDGSGQVADRVAALVARVQQAYALL
ncbi:hypothetical protein ATKI12_4433 [Kitasatospora sp. Ki12]